MTAHPQPPSAKIYQFPRKPQATAAARNAWSVRDERSRPLPTVEFGSGWYHDAAIQADRPRKS
jgi:uncharacterized protein DUF2735